MPVLMFLVLLSFNVARMGRNRLEVINAAREGAYANAYGFSLMMAQSFPPSTSAGQPITVSSAPTILSSGGDLLTVLEGGAGNQDPRIGILEGEPNGVVETQASASLFFSSPAILNINFVTPDAYYVVAAPAWERVDFPRGYDTYLSGDLPGVTWFYVMPSAFGQ